MMPSTSDPVFQARHTSRPASALGNAAVEPATPPSAPLMGIPLALTDYRNALDWIDVAVAARSRSYICVANVHTVMESQHDPELRRAVLNAAMTVPDGRPLVWALNAFGAHLDDRVYGPELMARACERAMSTGTRMYLYGGRNQGALVQLALNLRRRYPGLQIVGGHSPPFRQLADDERDAIAADINRSGADVVWVGIGVPKQEKWMAAMRERLDTPVLIGVGAAFDFHAGLIRQAPPWMQDVGLEWVFRLAQGPRRLWRRYLYYNPLFVVAFARAWARQRRR
jgi:N-acetylglucosaminyldiphosphoundecaprenol N-acetyl-beta-D-mannosaminyltransferase